MGYKFLGDITASIGFKKSSALTELSFIDLANKISGLSFSTGDNADDWLKNNGYWSSWGAGVYYLVQDYNPAIDNGSITFPDHATNIGQLNPNLVGQSDYSTYATQIYINGYDFYGNNNFGYLSKIINNFGMLTLTQGSNEVVYSFTNQSFQSDTNPDSVFADFVYEGSPFGSITVLKPATSDFNTDDPIIITHEIYPSSYSFTITSAMIDSMAPYYQADKGSPNGTSGFTVTNPGNLWNGVIIDLNNVTGINNAFTSAVATESGYNAYIVMAQWDSSSTVNNSLAKISFNGSQLIVTPVDGTNNGFTQGGNSGSNIVGTFNFPATFTFIKPLITNNDWC
jgi:hypothetical protein